MRLIHDSDLKALTDLFERGLQDPVTLAVFTQRQAPEGLPVVELCATCGQNEQLAHELASASPKLTVSVFDFVGEEEEARRYGIDKIPALALVGKEESRIRYFGVPSGYTFGTLVQAIVTLSRSDISLAPATREALASLKKDVHIQVFSTPT